MSFLDREIFGLINKIADDSTTYTARQKLKFTGSVLVTDDATENTTTIDVSGGGGGGGIPETLVPVAVSTVGTAGVSTKYARGDHAHALSVGTVQTLAAAGSSAWSFNSQTIRNVGAPSLATDAARLFEVNAVAIAGEAHPRVRACEGGVNIPLVGLSTPVDGYMPSDGDRIALTRQNTPSENGIWIARAGAWERPADWANGRALRMDYFFVSDGTSYFGQGMQVIEAGPLYVGMDAPNFDIFTQKAAVMGGDLSGLSWSAEVWKASGNPMTGTFGITAPKIRDVSDENMGCDTTYRGNVTVITGSPSTLTSHVFNWSAGLATVFVQVDMIDGAGTAESFTLRESRKFDGIATPVLIGTADATLKPVAPTATVSIVWGISTVSVSVVRGAATPTRFACKMHVFELPAP